MRLNRRQVLAGLAVAPVVAIAEGPAALVRCPIASAANTPLTATIENGELVVRVGIGVIAFAFEVSEENNPWDDDANDWRRSFRVSNLSEFAKDVLREMEDEDETGATPLRRFVDAMCQEAADGGSIALNEDERLHAVIDDEKTARAMDDLYEKERGARGATAI